MCANIWCCPPKFNVKPTYQGEPDLDSYFRILRTAGAIRMMEEAPGEGHPSTRADRQRRETAALVQLANSTARSTAPISAGPAVRCASN